ncbi:hypothetical protein [Pseudonocardia sp. HH130630-07]|uniref:hypothetical protein n=1 Tax=Pseudonocardia sp. HH130630-07 TaxID=1690815 RepID=UPI000814E738|nr:hypothetical protein [Pseudonocardia sp. HH130630-07]ANY07987.1 hypothetical protein AFB00_18680 [Pseudonocardia sp. HH130630-07]
MPTGEPGSAVAPRTLPDTVPAPAWVWLVRLLLVGAVALVVLRSPWLFGGPVPAWAGVLPHLSVAAGLVGVVPTAAAGWVTAARPYPHARTMLLLTRELDVRDRRAVAAALRRGRPVPAGHRAYARAWVARQRRGLMLSSVPLALVWTLVTDLLGRAEPPEILWFQAPAVVAFTLVALGSLAVQYRRERTVRAFGATVRNG